MKNTENSQKNVLIIGSGSMGYGDQRIHDVWIDKFNLFSKVEHESSIKKGKYKPLITLEGIDWDEIVWRRLDIIYFTGLKRRNLRC